MSYRLDRLNQKRERDEGIVCDWYRKPIRDFKTDPGWFWLNVMFFAYMIFAGMFLVYAIYEMILGDMSLFRRHYP